MMMCNLQASRRSKTSISPLSQGIFLARTSRLCQSNRKINNCGECDQVTQCEEVCRMVYTIWTCILSGTWKSTSYSHWIAVDLLLHALFEILKFNNASIVHDVLPVTTFPSSVLIMSKPSRLGLCTIRNAHKHHEMQQQK